MAYGPRCADCPRLKSKKRRYKKRCYSCEVKARRIRRQSAHEARVCATYGLRPGDYQKLYDAQDGKCAVPGCKARGISKYLAVEHDHKLGYCREAVRGLMCVTHNDMLGKAGDNPEVFEYLAEYLRNPPAKAVLK